MAVRRRIEEATERRIDGFDRLHASDFSCAETRRHISRLWSLSGMAEGPQRLAYDGHIDLLLGRLLALADRPAAQGNAILAHHVRRQLIDYVDAHMMEAIGVDALAAVAGEPALTFGRRFKATFGESPHRYVTLRRIERACELLRAPGARLADIAAATGFCDQSHMTRAFTTHLGVTPGEWRRQSLR